ncbi:MAG: hypothetical protein HY711_01160 [Candidatus Melainabacteria bacterium]|nr:hypothetical protein [Candidatus Melainabacteria bacterium]
MKKEALLRTGVCYWSNEDECHVAESPLFDRTAGVGATPEEAKAHFRQRVEDAYPYVQAGRVAERPGRPAKGGINVHMQVTPETKLALDKLVLELALSSQGEVVDFLLFFYPKQRQSIPKQSDILKHLLDIKQQLSTARQSHQPMPRSQA